MGGGAGASRKLVGIIWRRTRSPSALSCAAHWMGPARPVNRDIAQRERSGLRAKNGFEY
jgi:hypothetical protein